MFNFIIKKKYKNFKLYLLLIYSLWFSSLIIYFFFNELVESGSFENGVKLGNDSVFYLREARNIINGDISIFEHKTKFGYLIFLIPFLYFDLPLYKIVLFQIVLTSISSFCLYKISEKYFSKLAGVICMGIFLLYFPLQIRNFYILTETLFINLSIIFSFFIVYFNKKNLIPIIMLLLFLISIRPNGIIFLFSFLICLFFFLIKKEKYTYLSLYLITSIIIFIPVINFLNTYLYDLNLLKSLNRGIIWGYSFETQKVCKSSCLGIELINNNYPNSIFGYIQFISINFVLYFKIFFYKIFWMILRARPYYSDLHNLYILFFNIFLYSSFIYGFFKKPKNLYSLKFINCYLLLSMILVGLTFADWSGRFSLYILPFIMIFSSHGLLIFIKKTLNMINQKWNNAT